VDAQPLKDVAETLLITLYNRALESQRPDGLIHDERAVALVQQLPYDFARVEQIPISVVNRVTLILRSLKMDQYAQDFLARSPDSVVVHIGCGLDSRFERLDNGRVEWYDLDLPDVMALRSRLLGSEAPRYHLLACSALDPAWMEAMRGHHPRPFLVLAEGVFMYFTQAQVRALVLALRDHFPGAELVFDGFSPFHVWYSNRQMSSTWLGNRFHWGLWSGRAVERWGKGIRLLDDWGYLDSDEPRLASMRWMRRSPIASRAGRVYHFRLGHE
jgi:O-methyltransferase involved in polyketide biosynthesis